MSIFHPAKEELFFKSSKKQDPRLGELVLKNNPSQDSVIYLAGYPDDEGIRINGGRVGASQAPDMIRMSLYKMTPSAWSEKPLSLVDRGNLLLGDNLEKRHENLKNEIAQSLTGKNRWIGLGGGHDYGYPDGAGFLLSQQKSSHKPLVINFDAHLDVRPTEDGLSSGTPFFRLLSDKSLPAFDFLEVGLQSQCNSKTHLEWLKAQGGTALTLDELTENGQFVENFLEMSAHLLLHPRPAFLSVDIDAFSSAYAPGCSQSWATGLEPNSFMQLFKILLKRLDVRMLSIYEVSPPLDTDNRTSKLAAQIVHSFLHPSH